MGFDVRLASLVNSPKGRKLDISFGTRVSLNLRSMRYYALAMVLRGCMEASFLVILMLIEEHKDVSTTAEKGWRCWE